MDLKWLRQFPNLVVIPDVGQASIEQHVAVKRDRAHRATEARAYAPAGVWADEAVDFGIGSQR